MYKIIKEGLIDKKTMHVQHLLLCSRCGCVFKYKFNKHDCTEKNYGYGNIFLHCPKCNKEIALFLDKLINGEYDYNI